MSSVFLGKTKKTQETREQILKAVELENSNPVTQIAESTGLSRQTVHSHMKALVDMGFLNAQGKSKSRIYTLGDNRFKRMVYDLKVIAQGMYLEDRIFREDFSGLIRDAPKSVKEICHYGFTEIVNNAIDHSEGSNLTITLDIEKDDIQWTVKDDGEGIFKRIKRILGLYDEREALLELSKGKLTTAPDKHTGEGIFFSSRVFDSFYILSGELAFSHDSHVSDDWLLHEKRSHVGTEVIMCINKHSPRDLKTVFDEYSTGPDEYAFDKTIVPVRLAVYEGEMLVSRSQAKRLLSRVERFRRVVFDFEQVETVGQAFADEVFRVFYIAHPNIKLNAINTTENIDKMINRAISQR